MQINSSSLYRDIFKRAFFITLHNRFLWALGFFSTFLGLGSIYELVINKALKNSDFFLNTSYKFSMATVSGLIIGKNLDKFGVINIILLVGAILLSLAIVAAVVFLSISSLGSLIQSSKLLDTKKKTSLFKSFIKIKDKFWGLLSINLIGKALIFISLFVTGGLLSFILINHSVIRSILYLFFYLLLVAISLMVSFLIIYSSCFIVLKSDGVKKSIINSWRLFKENWVVSTESAVIMFAINAAIKLVLLLALVIFSIPFMLLLVVFYYSTLATAPIIVVGLWITFSVIFMILIGSFFSAFQIVAWTLLFDRIIKGGVLSKIHRIFG